MKRLLHFFVAMLLSAVAINSYAAVGATWTDTENKVTYTVTAESGTYESGGWTASAGAATGCSGDIVILDVVNIGGYMYNTTKVAGFGGTTITSVELPSTLVRIEDNAFINTKLTSITIPKNVSTILQHAFIPLSSLEEINVDVDNPYFDSKDGVLFNEGMTLLKIYPTAKTDESYYMPEGVTTLADNAFYNNNNLKNITLPTSFKNYTRNDYSGSFFNLTSLENIYVAEGNPDYSSYNGILCNKDQTKIDFYPYNRSNNGTWVVSDLPSTTTMIGTFAFSGTKYKEIVFPSSLEEIEDKAFLNCQNLTKLDFSTTNLKKIDSQAFGGCYRLVSVEFSETLEEIGSAAFQNCSGLTSISLPDSLTILGLSAFDSCSNLTTVTIGAGLSTIDGNAFSNCNKLAFIEVSENNAQYRSDEYGVLFNKNEDGISDTLITYPAGKDLVASYRIPDAYPFNVTTIGTSAFGGAKVKELIVPNTVKTMMESIFDKNGVLSKVTFEETAVLSSIGSRAFAGCWALTEFTLPASVETLGKDAFSGYGYNHKFIIEPNSKLKIIPGYCFSGGIGELIIGENSALETIDTYAFGGNTVLKSVDLTNCSNLKTIGPSVFQNNKTLESVILADNNNLQKINNYAFSGCSNLKTVKLGNSPDPISIGTSSFQSCTSLEEINIPNTVQSIGNLCFSNDAKLAHVYFEEPSRLTYFGEKAFEYCGLEELVLPSSIKTLSDYTFQYNTKLKTVEVPAAATSIAARSFYKCSSLEEINVDKANTVYSSSDGFLLTKNKQSLVIFPAAKANSRFTLLPPSITAIGNWSFFACDNLENVTIPNKVTKIGQQSFGQCENLKTVTFLCDNFLDPSGIDQGANTRSFDGGEAGSTNMFENITIYVRKGLADQYAASTYYQKFKGIETSFIDETSRVGGLNKTNAKEEFIYVGEGTVDLLSVDTEDETYVLPTTVSQGNDTYNVSLVGDYLFTAYGSNVPNVKEVVVPGDVQYIGARAFLTNASLTSQQSSVESVFLIGDELNEDLLSTARFELTAEDLGTSSNAKYEEFGADTKVYVRKSAEETYKTAWPHYTDIISYKIPYTQSGTYGTFAREFDVDFSEVNGVNAEKPVTDDPVLIAFTGDGKYSKNGDTFSVHMTSINLGDKTGKDGTFVPAGSGVLMKKYKEAEGEDGLYYQIAESRISEAFVDGNFMKGITLRPETIGAGSDVKRYYISGGSLHEMTKNTDFKNHKSYMELPADAVPAGAKVILSFDNWNDEATGIESINANVNDSDNLYNLQGQRVNNAGKGIYIKNGKKIFVK